MAFQQQSPMAKFEHSPAESLLSIPGDPYQSLFATATTPIAAPTMNPMEMMTPQSFNEAMSPGALNTIKEEEPATTPTPEPEKRTTKKRKSWGQVLPQPKTNLPPRKRAKTEDEKEQRRVERVLRNRRAAQSSRERKRLEVEALEQRNKELEAILVESQKTNMMLAAELDRYRRSSGIVTRSTSPLDSLRENPVTLSQELFSSQDPRKAMDEILRTSPHATVNPASLSPSLTPVDDSSETVLKQEPSMEANTSEETSSNSPVSTQHPAAMLTDLPCQTSAELPKSFLESQTSMPPTLVWLLQLQMMQLSASAILSFCQRPLTQIAASLKAGSSLLPTPQLLATIIWLVTLPRSTSTTTSTLANSSTRTETMSQNLWQRAISPQQTTATSPSTTTLRLKSLRKILSCSPSLARPLSDATLVALRLVSKGSEDQVEVLRRGTVESRGDDELTRCLSNMALPSKELLMTLLWSIRMEEQRIRRKAARGASLDSETLSPEQGNQQARKTVLRALPNRQSRLAGMGRGGTRRTRRS